MQQSRFDLLATKNTIVITTLSMKHRGNKRHLPSKICPVCQRPFTWRKKWANCWEEVKYCSERCRRQRTSDS